MFCLINVVLYQFSFFSYDTSVSDILIMFMLTDIKRIHYDNEILLTFVDLLIGVNFITIFIPFLAHPIIWIITLSPSATSSAQN